MCLLYALYSRGGCAEYRIDHATLTDTCMRKTQKCACLLICSRIKRNAICRNLLQEGYAPIHGSHFDVWVCCFDLRFDVLQQ